MVHGTGGACLKSRPSKIIVASTILSTKVMLLLSLQLSQYAVALAAILSKEVLSEEQIVSIDDLYTSLHEVPVEEFVDMACSINY